MWQRLDVPKISSNTSYKTRKEFLTSSRYRTKIKEQIHSKHTRRVHVKLHTRKAREDADQGDRFAATS